MGAEKKSLVLQMIMIRHLRLVNSGLEYGEVLVMTWMRLLLVVYLARAE